MLVSGTFGVRYAPDNGAKADIAGGPSCADTVAEVVAVTTGARIESDLLVQRIKVAILNSAANQCYAVESAKYFYNSICH
jgi:hypothetical protein